MGGLSNWQIFTLAAVEQEAVPEILHPFASQDLRSPRHCWQPFLLPLPQSKQSSANNVGVATMEIIAIIKL